MNMPVLPVRFSIFIAASAMLVPNSATAETLLVGNKRENSVSFIDIASGQQKARLETGPAPHEIALSRDQRMAAVVAYAGTSVDIFDTRKMRLIKRIDLSPNAAPHGVAWLRDGRLVLATEKSRSVAVIDAGLSKVRTIPLDQAGSHMLVVSPDEKFAYVANMAGGTVSVVDLVRHEKIRDIAVGGNPEGIAITRDGKHLWVGDDSGPRLRVIDLSTMKVIDTLATDPVPIRVVMSPDGRSAITSNIGKGTLSVFDVKSRKLIRTIIVSGKSEAIQVTAIFSTDGKRIYVAETGLDTIAEVDFVSGNVLRRLDTGKGGDGLAITH